MSLNDFDLDRARWAMRDYQSGAVEVSDPTSSMYLLDVITSEDGRDYISIMYDEECNTFALVAGDGADARFVGALELGMQRAEIIRRVELWAAIVFGTCETVDEATACWAELESSVSHSARLRIRELGGDVDEVMSELDAFFLLHPGV